MKKIILLLAGLGLAAGLLYFSSRPVNNETKTTGQPEQAQQSPELSTDTSLTTIDQELSATDLTDFDQEIQSLDKSISQL